MKKVLFAAVLTMAIVWNVKPVEAQIYASPRGGITQTLDGTTFTVEYSRPILGDRSGLFGGQIWWGHIWTPGADDATTFEFDNDMLIEGVEVPAGKYSVWMVGQDSTSGEMWLDPEWNLFHLPEPEKNDEQIYIWVEPDMEAPITDVLTFDFNKLDTWNANLRMRFENVQVDLDIEFPSQLKKTVSQEEAAQYLGSYAAQLHKNEWQPNDYAYDLVFSYADGHLTAPVLFGPPNEDGMDEAPFPDQMHFLIKTDLVLVPVAYDDNGKLIWTADFYFEFNTDKEGNPTTFELRTPKDSLWMSGSRGD